MRYIISLSGFYILMQGVRVCYYGINTSFFNISQAVSLMYNIFITLVSPKYLNDCVKLTFTNCKQYPVKKRTITIFPISN